MGLLCFRSLPPLPFGQMHLQLLTPEDSSTRQQGWDKAILPILAMQLSLPSKICTFPLEPRPASVNSTHVRQRLLEAVSAGVACFLKLLPVSGSYCWKSMGKGLSTTCQMEASRVVAVFYRGRDT